MYVLFLESKAARQCMEYTEGHPEVDSHELLQSCYEHGKDHSNAVKNDDWWVRQCLDGDSHKRISLVSMFRWSETPEGNEFWSNIHIGE